jgi:hypothetical protein
LSNARVHKYTGHNFKMRIYNDSRYNKDAQCRFCACRCCNHLKECKPCEKQTIYDCFKTNFCGMYENSIGYY